MSDVKWIKITTDIFDDEKILLIESLPECDSIIVIWFKLLCFAGKTNNSGVFLMGDSIPYTDGMLATIFRRKEATVKMALDIFERFGMIERLDGIITLPNWNKHQTLDAYERKKLRDREYQANRRSKQKALIKIYVCIMGCKSVFMMQILNHSGVYTHVRRKKQKHINVTMHVLMMDFPKMNY